jgi:uncharacterized protein YndB with AHSA1/START domain
MNTQQRWTLEVSTRVEAPREMVFSYLVDPAKYGRWMGVGAELDPRPGGRYRVAMPIGVHAAGEYTVVEPPERIVFTFGWEGSNDVPPGSSQVEITLEPDGGSTLVRLRHSELPSEEQRAQHTHGWTRYLSRLSMAVSGGDPGADEVGGP